MPLHHGNPEPSRWEKPPHEEIIDLVERKFDEIKRDLEEIKAKLRS